MELSKEHLIAFDEILKKYQTEYGEQEYKMYYDVDLPKIMMEAVNAYANSVERLLKEKMQELNEKCNNSTDATKQGWYAAQWNAVEELLTDLENLKP